MKPFPIALAALLFGTTIAAQQAPVVEYLITPRVFALAGAGSDEAVIIGNDVMLRTAAGRQASVNLVNREGDGTKLTVVPTDLGSGKIALRVEFSLIQAGQTTTAKFDVLSGTEAQRPTIAVRDEGGRFMRDQFGRPIYATFDATRRERR